MSFNPLMRSYDSARKDSQIINKVCVFKMTIKSANIACDDVIGEIYCLDALFEPCDIEDVFDSLFAFKASLDLDTSYHYQAMW